MKILSQFIQSESEYKGLCEYMRNMVPERPKPVMASGLSTGAQTVFLHALSQDIPTNPKLIITHDEKECLRLYNRLSGAGLNCAIYPVRDLMMHNVTSSHEYEHNRLSVLARVVKGDVQYVIATPDAACQYTMPKEKLQQLALTLALGEECSLTDLAQTLVASGYTRVDSVEGIAQFSIRGGICDVFVPGDEHPHRMELFGDEIDSIGIFDVMTQRRIENRTEFSIFPAREVIADDEAIYAIINAISSQLKRTKSENTRKTLNGELD